MNISQLFVTKRPIAWTAMISVLVWGVYAYLMMPQRQDPIIPVVTGVIITPYPGAEAEKVEQEVTRKIERKVAENPAVEHVKSISRPGMSVVYVDLFETERHAELVWQDIRGKLGEIKDLPVAAGRPTQSILNKDFGDSVAVMLTLSSPPVSDLEIQLRARNIREAIEAHRKQTPTTMPAERRRTSCSIAGCWTPATRWSPRRSRPPTPPFSSPARNRRSTCSFSSRRPMTTTAARCRGRPPLPSPITISTR